MKNYQNLSDRDIEDTREPPEYPTCDECGAALEWDDEEGIWYCPECDG